ncbi:hypothetical protein [Thiomicrorhabdus arctica]|uniref:hypothetical protein n=1 Tax=Thiomicrorhabdus arctica TaxID=131540 RepID=UPI0003751322|nr:hypothetical protein [Thiomicrorhabdus arctica]
MEIIFYVTDDALTSYNDANNEVSTFLWQDDGAIDQYLSTVSEKSQVSIVLDVLDEDISFEWAPAVFSWEKSSILDRRKERIFGEDIALAEVHWTNAKQQNSDGRKEELMMSATISDSFRLKNFLQSIEAAQLTVSRIYSKPILLEGYLKSKVKAHFKLSRQSLKNPLLLVTRQSQHTFRQTFYYEGDLRISRLVEIDKIYQTATQIRSALINETKLAVTYVYNQQIVPFNSPIGLIFIDGEQDVLEDILVHSKEEALVRSTWEEDQYLFATAAFNSISPNGVHCGIPGSECFSPQAIVDFIFSDSPKGFYTTPYTEKVRNLVLTRKVLIGLNILLFLGGMYYVLVSGVNTLISWQKQALLQESIAQHEIEINRLEEMVKLQDDAQFIKASVEFSESILQLKVNRLVNFDIASFSQVIARHPNIQLSSLQWKTLGRLDSTSNQISFSAWVFPFHETYKAPVAWVDAFVADLRTLPGIQSVVLQKEPLNRALSQTLLMDVKKGEVKALPFTIQMRVNDVESK